MPRSKRRGFVMSGGDVDTLAEVEEALRHLSAVPPDERGDPWYAYQDTLIDEWKRLGGEQA